MKVSTQQTENSQLNLDVVAEPEEVERFLEEAYRHLVQRTDVPGFRRGKAPRAMLERYLGREALLEEALDHLIPHLLNQAIEERGIDAIAQPQVEVTGTDPVTFKATFPLRPKVNLGNYKEIRIPPEPAEVAEDAEDRIIEDLRHQYAPWEPVERPVKFGDLVTIDVVGNVDEQTVLDRKDLQFQVLKDLLFPMPGFTEKLEGLEKGQEKEFTLTFPADYASSELAGKECRFKVAVSEIKEQKLPELDDEFAKSVGEGFETIASLRERVSSNLRLMAEERARRRHEEKIIDAVVEQAQIEFPQLLVERDIDRIIAEQERELRENRVSLQDYLRSRKKTEEELRGELRPLSTKRVRQSLVLAKVIEEEGIEVTEEEIDKEIEAVAEGTGEKAEQMKKRLNSSPVRQSLQDMIANRKAVKRLLEIASGKSELI